MKYIFIFTLFFLSVSAHAQIGQKLKERIKQAVEQKANQRADETIGKGVETADSILLGKKKIFNKKNKKKNKEGEQGTDNTGSFTAINTVESNYKEVIIATNIRCQAGKEKIETLLRKTDGVSSVMIDTDNGKLYLSSSNADDSAKIIELIRKNGFEADGKKPTKTIADPCKQ